MKIKLILGIGLEGQREEKVTWDEISDLDPASISPETIDSLIYDYWKEWAWQFIDGCGEIIES